jgi:hypothetical protein
MISKALDQGRDKIMCPIKIRILNQIIRQTNVQVYNYVWGSIHNQVFSPVRSQVFDYVCHRVRNQA